MFCVKSSFWGRCYFHGFLYETYLIFEPGYRGRKKTSLKLLQQIEDTVGVLPSIAIRRRKGDYLHSPSISTQVTLISGRTHCCKINSFLSSHSFIPVCKNWYDITYTFVNAMQKQREDLAWRKIVVYKHGECRHFCMLTCLLCSDELCSLRKCVPSKWFTKWATTILSSYSYNCIASSQSMTYGVTAFNFRYCLLCPCNPLGSFGISRLAGKEKLNMWALE